MPIVAADSANFQTLLGTLRADWQKVKPAAEAWLSLHENVLRAAFKFLAGAIPQFVKLAESIAVSGSDKKMLVENVVNPLFDTVVWASLPVAAQIALTPFRGIFLSLLDGLIEGAVVNLVGAPAPSGK